MTESNPNILYDPVAYWDDPDRPKVLYRGGPEGWPELPGNPYDEPWPGAWDERMEYWEYKQGRREKGEQPADFISWKVAKRTEESEAAEQRMAWWKSQKPQRDIPWPH